jgi:hypothetical protein
MRTQLTLTGPAPAYAASSFKGLRVKNPNAAYFADFARAAAEHFQGRVDRYAIWNGPTIPGG